METIVIKLPKDKFNSLLLNGALADIKYEIKEVIIEDDLFKDDMIYKELKDKSIKAYKQLKEYQFNKLHNIKTK
jgi:hypothetical protein